MEGLPRYAGVDTVLLVVDRLTKYIHFLALKHPFTTADVAALFVRDDGFPSTIVSDQGIECFLVCYGVNSSSSKAPNSTGARLIIPSPMAKRKWSTNGWRATYVAFLMGNPSSWSSWLPWAEYCYNTSTHSLPFALLSRLCTGRTLPCCVLRKAARLCPPWKTNCWKGMPYSMISSSIF